MTLHQKAECDSQGIKKKPVCFPLSLIFPFIDHFENVSTMCSVCFFRGYFCIKLLWIIKDLTGIAISKYFQPLFLALYFTFPQTLGTSKYCFLPFPPPLFFFIPENSADPDPSSYSYRTTLSQCQWNHEYHRCMSSSTHSTMIHPEPCTGTNQS